MPSPRKNQLQPCWDLRPHLENLNLISFNVGPDKALYVLAEPHQTQFDSLPKSTIATDIPTTYVVLRCDDGITRTTIDHTFTTYYQSVHPLPNQELLMVCNRSFQREIGDHDLNAHVFTHDGILQRSFLLGDGINHVATTLDGQIWTGYFDEGVFGNYGWDKPVGNTGLICWNSKGHQIYKYKPLAGLGRIYDCYALNVTSNYDTWCYYYSDFPLVRINEYHIVGQWKPPIEGARGFAYCDTFLLMDGGYNNNNRYVMFHLKRDGNLEHLWDQTFVDETGQPFETPSATLNGDCVIMRQGLVFYRVTLNELLV